jgi:hypothetical protein
VNETKKKKKVNQLTIKECEAILTRLAGQSECKYYQHVLNHYRKLLPSHGMAIELAKVDSYDSATLP